MNCAECTRLRAEREAGQLKYTMAVSRMKTAAMNTSGHGEYLNLSANARDAKTDLDRIDSELTRHQAGHAATD